MCTCSKCKSRREAIEAMDRVTILAPRYVPTYKTPLIPDVDLFAPDRAPDHVVDLERHDGYHQEQP